MIDYARPRGVTVTASDELFARIILDYNESVKHTHKTQDLS